MRKEDKVLNFIELIKGPDTLSLYDDTVENLIKLKLFQNKEEIEWESPRRIIEEIFTSGNCGRFSMILRFVFPEGESYIIKNDEYYHIVTKIGERFYDITGDVTEKFKDHDKKIASKEEVEENMSNYSFRKRGPIV